MGTWRPSTHAAAASVSSMPASAARPTISSAVRHVEAEEQRPRAAADDQRDGKRVEQVLDRQPRDRGHQRYAVADEHRLRRLADEEAERA